jgi:hypothetical protein
MELSRRGFVRKALAGIGLAALGGFRVLSVLVKKAAPRFPGRIRSLGDPRRLGPGKWAG